MTRLKQILEKISKGAEKEISVSPDEARTLTDVDKKLLELEAEKHGKKIGFGMAARPVPDFKELPEDLSISKPKVLKATEDHYEFNLPLLKFNFKNLIYAGVLAVLVGFFALYYLVPKATIKIYPETRILTAAKDITISEAQKTTAVEAATIGGQLVSVKKEKNAQFAATGENKARGSVLFTNTSGTDYNSIDKGTVITNDSTGKKYTADIAFSIPGHSSARVNVTAAGTGAEYNVNDGAGDFTIECCSLTAGKSEGITGGEKKTVTKEDVEDAKKKLSATTEKEARAELEKNLPEGKLVESTIKKEISERSVPEVGKIPATGKFELFLTVTLSAMVFDESGVVEILKKTSETSLKEGEVIYKLDKTKIIYKAVTGSELKSGKVKINATLTVLVGGEVIEPDLKKRLAGKSRAEAEKILDEAKGVRDFSIETNPGWFKNIPRLSRNIKIETVVESPTGEDV